MLEWEKRQKNERKAVANLNDENALARIAMETPCDEIGLAAVSKIHNHRILADIAKHDGQAREACREAVRKISDRSLLVEIALADHLIPAEMVIEKLSAMDAQHELELIARHSKNYYVRAKVMDKLTGREILDEIASAEDCTGVFAPLEELSQKHFAFQDGVEVDGWYYIKKLQEQARIRSSELFGL